jgi:MFS family permease
MPANPAALPSVPLPTVLPGLGERRTTVVSPPRLGALKGATTLGLFTALSLTCYLDRFIMGALVTPVKIDLGLTDEQVGRIEAVFNIAYVVGVPLFGLLGDRFRRKGLLTFGLMLWSIASIGSGFSSTLVGLLLWRTLVGFGEGSFNTLAPTWLADVFPSRVRNLAFSIFNSASKVGATLGVVIGGAVAARYNWQAAFWFAGLPGLLLAVGLFQAREPARGDSDGVAPPTRPGPGESLAILRQRDFVLYVLGYTGYMIAISTMFLWGPAYMHRVFGLTNAAATAFFGLGYTVAGLPGAFLGGIVGTVLFRRGRSGYALTLSFAMVLVAPALVAALTTTSLPTFRVLIWTEMVLFGLCSAPVTTLVFETVPIAQRAVALAVALVWSSGVGGLFPTTVVGLLSDHWGLRQALFVSPAAALLAAAAWALLARRQARSVAPYISATALSRV